MEPYPENSVTSEELLEIYPAGSNLRKADPVFEKRVNDFLVSLQLKEKGIYDLWKSFVKVSVEDYKKMEEQLNVKHIDYWYGESDADDAVRLLVKKFNELGILEESEGCKVVRVNKVFEGNPVPPFIMIKTNGTIKYESTDLGTIYNRVNEFNPDRILYVVDKRQSLQMFFVFNVAYQAGIIQLKN